MKEKDKQKGPEHKEVLGLVQSFSSQLQHHGAATTLTAKHATQAQPAAEPKSSLHAAPRRREAESTERRVEQATSKAVESAAPPAPSSAAPRSSDAPAEVAAPAQARPAELSPEHTLLQLALVDTSLQVDVRQSVVQVAMQTEAAGALALEVRMHEGQAHVRIDGPASPLVAQRADELRAVLSQQGLSLGNFTSGQGQGQQPALDVDDQRVPSAGPARVNDPARARHEGRIDVEA